MVFRKYAVNERTMQILALVCTAGTVWALTELYPWSGEDMPALLVFLFIHAMMLLTVCNSRQEMIRIDEKGIACLRRKRTLWFLAWDEIASIRTAHVYRCRGYVIVPKSPPVADLQKPGSAPNFQIQHTRALRAALETYGVKFE